MTRSAHTLGSFSLNTMIDLAQNMNRLGAPGGTEEMASQVISKSILSYPDSNGFGVGTRALSKFFGVPENSIALGSGATEIIRSTFQMFTPRQCVLLLPTFWEYAYFAEIFQTPVLKLFSDSSSDFQHDISSIDDRLVGGEIVFICNVNNPTSTFISPNDIFDLASRNLQTQFVIDETYLLFRDDFNENTTIFGVTERENVHCTISLSKFFSIPGVRLGGFFSDATTLERYLRFGRVPFATADYAQRLLEYVLADNQYVVASREFYRQQRLDFGHRIEAALPDFIAAFPAEGPFTLFKLLYGSSLELCKHLIGHGILVRSGHEFEGLGEHFVRIAQCTGDDEKSLVAALADYRQKCIS